MSIEHNSNSFADYELSPWEISSTEPGAGTFSPLETALGTGKTSNWNGLIAEPTNELFDKMWESVDGLTEPPTTTPTFSSAPIVPVEVKPLAANAFVRTQPLDELEASAVAHQKFLDLVRLTNVSPKTSQKNNSSENNNKTSVNNALTFDQLWEIQTRDLPPLVQKPKPAAPEAEAVPTIKTAPKVESAPKKDEAPLTEEAVGPDEAAPEEPVDEGIVKEEAEPAAPAESVVQEPEIEQEAVVPEPEAELETEPEAVAPEPEAELEAEPEAVVTEPEAEPEAEVEPVKKNGKAWLWIIIGIIAAAAIFLLALMILGRVAPDLVDRFLYSEDELRIINY